MDYHSDRFADFSAVIEDEAGRAVALFPANRVGPRLTSHGGLSYGGMISDNSMTTSRALDIFPAWFEFCRQAGVRDIIYKAVPPIYHRIPADEDRYALFVNRACLYRREVLSVVDLANPAPTQQRRRRGAERARKLGMRFSESEDFELFWPILEANLQERHGVHPVHSVSEIRTLRDRFPDNIRLFVSSNVGQICAGTVLFCSGLTVHAQYIASTSEARASGALDLLFAELLQAIAGEARYFDFGNSNEHQGRYLNRGLADFKEGFGARAICHDFYQIGL